VKLAFIGEAAPAFKENGQVAVSQSNPGEFNLAMAAVLALLQFQSPDASPYKNICAKEPAADRSVGEGSFEPVSLSVVESETVVSEKQAVSPQEPGQVDHEAPTPTTDTDFSKYLFAGQVQDSSKVVTAGISKEAELKSEHLSMHLENGLVQPRITGNPGESRGNSPVFAGILPNAADNELTQPQNQNLARCPQIGSVFSPAEALTSAKETVTFSGQDFSLLAATVKETVTANVKDKGPLFTEAARETAVGTGQANKAGAAADGTGSKNTIFARLEGSVAQKRDYVFFEKALADGASPAFDVGSMSVLPGKSETAAAAPVGEIRNSGETVKPTGKEDDAVLSGKESVGSGITGEVEKAKTGADRSVEKALAPNLAQVDTITPKANPMENQKTVSIPDLKDSLVQEIERFYNNRKSEPLTQVHLKLEPEHLGKLTIKLFFSNGELNAHFYTGSGYVKDVLEGSIQQLRENLDQQDLRLNQAFVFVGDEGRSGMGQSESESRQAAPFSGFYSGRTYPEATTESNGFEPPGSAYKLVNYLI